MPNSTPIKAGPTKAFFVKMLTRDIELADAILDLLDNCVDGVVRELKRLDKSSANGTPYTGYWAKIKATPDGFEIWDNCGGIPQDIAEKSAFMLGRPDQTRDSDIETVGMYGIGMKRAMFKMGRHSVVISQPETGPYKVEIPRSGSMTKWTAPMKPAVRTPGNSNSSSFALTWQITVRRSRSRSFMKELADSSTTTNPAS